MRPTVKFLNDELIKQIIAEAIQILCELGVKIQNKDVLAMLSEHGVTVDMEKLHATLTEEVIEKALKTAPHSFKLYDVHGNETHDLSGYNVYFTPGSAALNILDYQTKQLRAPLTEDYISYAKVVSQLQYIASQSTALIPMDVHDKIADSYRLFLSLLYCEKPVVT